MEIGSRNGHGTKCTVYIGEPVHSTIGVALNVQLNAERIYAGFYCSSFTGNPSALPLFVAVIVVLFSQGWRITCGKDHMPG